MITFTAEDMYTLGGIFLACYGMGFGIAFLIKAFVKGTETI